MTMNMKSIVMITICVVSSSNAFTIPLVGMPLLRHSQVTTTTTTTTTALNMGLFDGVKDAFSAPALARGTLDSERETPIDRWMGWSVTKENQQQAPNGAYDRILYYV